MAFTFEITHVDRFPRARIGVLAGKILEGSVNDTTTVDLVHGEQRLPLRLKGTVMGLPRRKLDFETISLTADLRQPAMQVVEEGDRLVVD